MFVINPKSYLRVPRLEIILLEWRNYYSDLILSGNEPIESCANGERGSAEDFV